MTRQKWTQEDRARCARLAEEFLTDSAWFAEKSVSESDPGWVELYIQASQDDLEEALKYLKAANRPATRWWRFW